jgi:hypothetical protein
VEEGLEERTVLVPAVLQELQTLEVVVEALVLVAEEPAAKV